MWILWKMRHSKCEFKGKIAICYTFFASHFRKLYINKWVIVLSNCQLLIKETWKLDKVQGFVCVLNSKECKLANIQGLIHSYSCFPLRFKSIFNGSIFFLLRSVFPALPLAASPPACSENSNCPLPTRASSRPFPVSTSKSCAWTNTKLRRKKTRFSGVNSRSSKSSLPLSPTAM